MILLLSYVFCIFFISVVNLFCRFFSDLMMWERSAPSAVETAPVNYSHLQNNIHVNLASQVGFSSNQKFFMCRSGFKDGKYPSNH